MTFTPQRSEATGHSQFSVLHAENPARIRSSLDSRLTCRRAVCLSPLVDYRRIYARHWVWVDHPCAHLRCYARAHQPRQATSTTVFTAADSEYMYYYDVATVHNRACRTVLPKTMAWPRLRLLALVAAIVVTVASGQPVSERLFELELKNVLPCSSQEDTANVSLYRSDILVVQANLSNCNSRSKWKVDQYNVSVAYYCK